MKFSFLFLFVMFYILLIVIMRNSRIAVFIHCILLKKGMEDFEKSAALITMVYR